MSVLIKGMKMPKEGRTKSITICSDGVVFEDFDSERPSAESNPVFKAVPVPPHGRLGDLDAIERTIKPWSPEDERAGCTFDTVKKLMHTMLNRAPTIIPAEEGET